MVGLRVGARVTGRSVVVGCSEGRAVTGERDIGDLVVMGALVVGYDVGLRVG